MEKYKIKSISFLEASKVWELSPNACIYNNPLFLENYKNITFVAVIKGEEIVCCWPIQIIDKKMVIPNFFYYFGPFWSSIALEQPKHSWLSTSNNVYTKFIEFFIENFKEINFQLHYSLLDVRIFDWWNYGLSNKKRFEIKPRYFSKINLKNKTVKKNIISDFRYVRRYEIKNFKKISDNLTPCDHNTDEMYNLYLQNNSEKFSIKLQKNLKENIHNIIDLVEKNFGKIKCFKDKKTNKLVYFNLVLFDKNSVHLVLNCSNKDWKKLGIMAWGINGLLNEYHGKFKTFDFNGANSPLRGDDKHSYGAEEKLYFQIKY